MIKFKKPKSPLETISPAMLIIIGFLLIILIGTILLTLPVSSRSGKFTPVKDAMFTSVSATCVTGLIVHDAYTYWSLFGQIVIVILLQIGGIGFITIFTSALLFTGKKIGYKQRVVMQESVGATQIGGIVRMTKFIILASFTIELAGTILLSFTFCPKLGFWKGVYFAFFHSVSAFCNGGMDLMGCFEPGSSLRTESTNVYFNIVIMLLITIGGLGFFVWNDIIKHRFHFSRYRLHSKIVLCTSAVLTFGGALIIFILEHNSPVYSGTGMGERVLTSLFQSVTCRTAGFSSVDLTEYTPSGQFFMTFLMLIGGSSGSTAGGIKTTTLAVLLMSVIVVFKKKRSIECFHKRLPEEAIHNACCLIVIYLTLIMTSSIVISTVDDVGLTAALFETTSAIGTVGLSLDLTPTLSTVSQIILMILMFIGRMGGLTLLLAFSRSIGSTKSLYPEEKITVG